MLKPVSQDPCLKVYYLTTSTVSITIHKSDLNKYICTLTFSYKANEAHYSSCSQFVYSLENRHFQCLDSW